METHILVEEVERFNQHYTAFARARWDVTCVDCKKRSKPAKEIAASGKPGYTLEDFALHAGAWAMAGQIREHRKADTMADYMESAEREQNDQYEPADWGLPSRSTLNSLHACTAPPWSA